jgi:dual specificity phosphatase 12
MTEIEPGIFVGNIYSSFNQGLLGRNQICGMLSLSCQPNASCDTKTTEYVRKPRQKFVFCADSSSQGLLGILDAACDFIEAMSLPVHMVELAPKVQQMYSTRP